MQRVTTSVYHLLQYANEILGIEFKYSSTTFPITVGFRACVRNTRARACGLRACVRACMCAYARACVRVRACVRTRERVCAVRAVRVRAIPN